ncbi:MAG: flavodoxin family protein [Clostridium sp.]|jgi:multimeric flavodoxin WrbA|uniref:flavodoxin family protein n=1 Tax=Clostridium sp. TaxID=1506 RepID=UPI0025C2B522|nr:flavodoxin family protein [Clostridium sp.]MCH3965400.1 flavodoxin family protein [Clostridium sp.]MCI1717368.1 flavodoxin family protein [Clostridium sp.]MCI1801708.1 flavodoxin family protein [Clostridium sp.]MCI1815541.1 flavodoxin family protein [Clostridium sp.]MCI1872444.1 flavodoxin family protein [Clostridium sp.]
MSKVVVFKGSPRKNGYTAKLLEQVAKGAKSKGAEVIEFDLNDPGIRGCQGCFYCRTYDGCAVNDYLRPMYKAINEADAIVFGSPIYYYQITGQARVWLDRTFPMVGGLKDTLVPRHPDKKLITIFVQGNPDPKIGADGIKFVNDIFKIYGWKLEDSIHYCGTSHNPDLAMFDELSLRAFKDGEHTLI